VQEVWSAIVDFVLDHSNRKSNRRKILVDHRNTSATRPHRGCMDLYPDWFNRLHVLVICTKSPALHPCPAWRGD